jgi:hypothetical protein
MSGDLPNVVARADPFQMLFLGVVDDHVGQERNELRSLPRSEGSGLRFGEDEFGVRRPTPADVRRVSACVRSTASSQAAGARSVRRRE